MASSARDQAKKRNAENSVLHNNEPIIEANKQLFVEAEINALSSLHRSLLNVQPDNFDQLTQILGQHFWPERKNGAIPLLDAISKLNPKFQQKIKENRPNQAYQQIRLRWTQSDSIYCLAFEIPNNNDYYLAKVGMTATAGEYCKSENKTYSRFEDLEEDYEKQFSQSQLGSMNLKRSQPGFPIVLRRGGGLKIRQKV